jgi:hypothetical protein
MLQHMTRINQFNRVAFDLRQLVDAAHMVYMFVGKGIDVIEAVDVLAATPQVQFHDISLTFRLYLTRLVYTFAAFTLRRADRDDEVLAPKCAST